MSKTALWEAVKEPLRWLIIAIIPVLVNWISGQPWNPQLITYGVIVLRMIDKILHDYGKEAGNELLEGGLTRF